MKNILFMFFCMICLLGSYSCSKKESDIGYKEKVTVKITGSPNLVILNAIVTKIDFSAGSSGGGLDTKSFPELKVNEWTKDFTFKNSINVSVNGETSDKKEGTMKTQIIDSNGKVLRESNTKGKILINVVEVTDKNYE